MAYNAKTNWQLNDTVMPADMNRIEQGIKDNDTNKEEKTNLLTSENTVSDGDVFPFYDTSAQASRKTLWSNIKSVLKTYFDTTYAKASTGVIALYVSTSGNDTTGNGSENSPFRTITKALSTIPKNLNGFSASINIAAGSYSEAISVKDFYGGQIAFTGVSGAVVNSTSLTIDNAVCTVNQIKFSLTNNVGWCVQVKNHGLLAFGFENEVLLNGIAGVSCESGSFRSEGYVTLGVTGTGISVGDDGVISISLVRGSARGAFQAIRGGMICYTTESVTVSGVKFTTSGGGKIYTGSQLQVPSY